MKDKYIAEYKVRREEESGPSLSAGRRKNRVPREQCNYKKGV